VPREQLRTANYSDDARERLGKAVEAARVTAGFPSRREFAAASPGVSKRSLDALETGEPVVGQKVLRAVGTSLGRYVKGWDADMPERILEGAKAPRPVAVDIVWPPRGIAVDLDGALLQPAGEPDPADFSSELEYQRAVYWYLRRGKKMSHEAVMRGFQLARAIFEEENRAERNGPDTSGEEVG
jgi:hypothetical protein